MDAECKQLVEAMNRFPGIETTESCCGHGTEPFRIWFTAENLEALPRLLYCFDWCHCGCPGWKVVATTDCAMNPVRFEVEGPMGKDGYNGAAVIAARMIDYLEGNEK